MMPKMNVCATERIKITEAAQNTMRCGGDVGEPRVSTVRVCVCANAICTTGRSSYPFDDITRLCVRRVEQFQQEPPLRGPGLVRPLLGDDLLLLARAVDLAPHQIPEHGDRLAGRLRVVLDKQVGARLLLRELARGLVPTLVK